MTVGLIGAGNMARALAQGWDEPVLSTDAGSGRARELVAEGGGRAPSSYGALIAEAQIDAAVRHGMPNRQAAELALRSLAGSASLLVQRGGDTLAVRREVASPGGLTARGLEALERGGLRSAFMDAM